MDCRLVRSSRSGRFGPSAVKSLNLASLSSLTLVDYLSQKHKFYTAQTRTSPPDTVLIRIRAGPAGHSEWINEIQVYLLPQFKHKNILAHYRPSGGDLSSASAREPMIYPRCQEDADTDQNDPNSSGNPNNRRIKLEYWLMNNFTKSITLRQFLQNNTLSWPDMLNMALGISRGLHFLHEYCEYHTFDPTDMMNRYVRSTNGRLKKISFVEQNCAIKMQPYLTIAVIHRNLSSFNVVLKADLTPCIYNFGLSYIHHPFQPSNKRNLIEYDLKKAYLESQYSPPEVLQETGHLSLLAMKSIDMYACGILFWELVSRCVLPDLDVASEEEQAARKQPDPYYEPFQREFGDQASAAMLKHAVCRIRARPGIKSCWLVGRKTNRFVQTMQDLWDHDFEARLQAATLVNRLAHLSRNNRDKRNRYTSRTSKTFDLATMWPPQTTSFQTPPYPTKCEPNILIESISHSENSSLDGSSLELSLVEEQTLFRVPTAGELSRRAEPTGAPSPGSSPSSPSGGFVLIRRSQSRSPKLEGSASFETTVEEILELSSRISGSHDRDNSRDSRDRSN